MLIGSRGQAHKLDKTYIVFQVLLKLVLFVCALSRAYREIYILKWRKNLILRLISKMLSVNIYYV